MNSKSMTDKLQAIRQEMAAANLDAFLVPREDEYLGEYVPARNERLAWVSGFAGSAGMVIVLKNKAAIFVDGRYTLQARQQVPTDHFEHHHLIEQPPIDWLSQQLAAGSTVGIDSRMHSHAWFEATQGKLHTVGIKLQEVATNPIDKHWADRPAHASHQALLLEDTYTGESSLSKRQRVGKAIKDSGADLALIYQLDSIAWLLNIRGSDVPRVPVIMAFATLDTKGEMTLFTDLDKLPKDFPAHVGKGVTVKPDDLLEQALQEIGSKRFKVLADPGMTNAWSILCCRKAGAQMIIGDDPALLPKACKNNIELNGIRNCHLRDGVAVTRYLAWIDREVSEGRLHDEGQLADKLEAFRMEQAGIHDLSFDTISAAGANGALPHYHYQSGKPALLEQNNLYLVDSGGQYADGTTDITRTVVIGEASEEHKRMFTLVLKGHIALAMAVFPKGTSGVQLDALARQFLWQEGCDYDHGTGHGVGAFLSVHEGPQRITKRGPQQELLPGMVISNEPGYYEEGNYGIRCENLVIVMERADGMLHFETISLAPFDLRLVNNDMMNQAELDWLNSYHRQVRDTLAPLMNEEDRIWLEGSTRQVG